MDIAHSTYTLSTFHRSIAHLIDSFEQSSFWVILIGFLHQHVHFDTWVVLVLSDQHPRVLSEFELEEEDPFINYLDKLYTQDPFYIRNRAAPKDGTFVLNDVKPEHFEESEYYLDYFRLIANDELSLHVTLSDRTTLSVSLGTKGKFSDEEISTLRLFEPWLISLLRRRMTFENPTLKYYGVNLDHQQNTFKSNMREVLTSREIEVSFLIVRGYSDKEVAQSINISAETAKVHRRNIFHKLNIKLRSELYSLYLKE